METNNLVLTQVSLQEQATGDLNLLVVGIELIVTANLLARSLRKEGLNVVAVRDDTMKGGAWYVQKFKAEHLDTFFSEGTNC